MFSSKRPSFLVYQAKCDIVETFRKQEMARMVTMVPC